MTALLVPGSAEWLKTISSSKVAAILGLSPWESPRSLWHKMHGDIPPEAQTSAQSRGTFLEAGLLAWFFADHPELTRLGGESTVRSERLPWASCSPDDIATDPVSGEQFPIEAKTDARGVFGEPGTDEIPLYYLVQGLWTMHVGGWSKIVFPVLGPFLERQDYTMEYAPLAELAADIEARCFAFWQSLQIDTPPELDGSVATYEALRSVSTAGDGDWECPPDLARELCQSRTDIAAAEGRHNLARSRVLDLMGDAKRVICGGQVLGQKQSTKSGKPALYPPRKAVDLDALPTLTDKAAA